MKRGQNLLQSDKKKSGTDKVPKISMKIFFFVLIISLIIITGCVSQPNTSQNNQSSDFNKSGWENAVMNITWVAYSPPSADPNKGIEASTEAITSDLIVLRKAGFTGLVTYSSQGRLGKELPKIAQYQGFKGIIMGIYNPANPEEIANAKEASKLPITTGYCIGNEGLHKRYEIPDLNASMNDLRNATGKPVTTAEEIEDYSNETLLLMGDWVFPNAHPYFHNQITPESAAAWTVAAYNDTVKRSKKFVIFKEVGLPTEGDPGRVSEANQDQYYQILTRSNVKFVYFEAFDQPWKNSLPVEPHWGIFYANQSPKIMGLRLLAKTPVTTISQKITNADNSGTKITATQTIPGTSFQPAPFYVYQDIDSQNNHFTPSGYMGDIGDIQINEVYGVNPHSGKTSIQIKYDAKGQGPNECSYTPACKWAGVYWQEPPNNWGTDAFLKDRGYDLTRYHRLLFWARADKASTIEFKVGGILGPYGDSVRYPQGITAKLDTKWKQYEIDLTNENLSHIVGGFAWVSNWDTNPDGAIFYLDDIRFE